VRVTVFGASGGIGRQVVTAALAAGHEVSVLARDPARLSPGERDRLLVTVGELPDAIAIERAVAGSQAVIWAAGPTRNSPDQPVLFEAAACHLVAAMERHGVRRLIALSGAGVTMPGERKPLTARLISGFVALAVRHVVAAKDREREVFGGSGLDWTLVRPPRVIEGAPTGRAILSDRLAGPSVTQGDVAGLMVGLLVAAGAAAWLRGAPYVSLR
jgi:putative NADH-flavin reductase